MTRFWGLPAVLAAMSSLVLAQVPTGQFPSVPGLPQTPPRDVTKTGTARIRGRVVAADSGQALRKVQIRATSGEVRENRLAVTDDRGNYEIGELPAGRYQLSASKGSFVSLQYGQLRPFEPGKPLQIGDGQTIDKIDFSLPRGSIITGRVLDEVGEPATDVQVSVMRYQYVQGRRQLVNAGGFSSTNDLGEYRLYGLPPGQYYVSATLRFGNPFDTATSSDRSGYAPTYYPGTASISEAQRLTMEVGQVRGGVDVVLMPARMARITGTAVDSDGKPITNGMLIVAQTAGAGFISSIGGGQVRADGSFSVSNVAPGEYTIGIAAGSGLIFGGADTISATVTVAGEDIAGLRLTGVKPSTVSGRVVLPQAGAGGIRASSIQLLANALRPSPLGGGGTGKVSDDFTFEMKVQPGQRLIRLSNPPPGVSLKAVRLNGTELIDSGIEIRPNEDVGGLEVELTTQQSEVSGIVTDPRGRPLLDYSVVVFARDSSRWTNQSRYFGGGRPDQDGRFKVRGLPPGDYFAIALEYIEPGAGTDPEVLERIRPRATEFSLTDGQTRSLDLKLVEGL
jgi:hypothetical protein